jgi:hypothetical protein
MATYATFNTSAEAEQIARVICWAESAEGRKLAIIRKRRRKSGVWVWFIRLNWPAGIGFNLKAGTTFSQHRLLAEAIAIALSRAPE